MVKFIEKDSIIGVKDLRDNLDKYIKEVKKGRSFTVFRHSEPVFGIVPPSEVEYDLDELDGPGWKTVIDFTKIKKGGVPASEVAAALKRLHEQGK